MRILIVDYLSFSGHKRFNKIHIEALAGLGHELFFVGREGQFPESPNTHFLCSPPERFFKVLPLQSISSRIQNILCLRWIYAHVKENQYDVVLFPTYDIMSLFFSPFKSSCIVINHNNIGQLDSRIKAWMTRHLPKRIIHVALDSVSKERLESVVPEAKVYMVPHGYDEPSHHTERPQWLQDDKRFLFCPINRNFDLEEVNELFTDSRLSQVLKDNNCCLYVKNCGIAGNSMLKFIPASVPQKEYDYLIQNAQSVILPYSNSFRYRVSGIFFECLAANTSVIVPEIDAFTQFRDFNVSVYSDAKAFVECVESVLNNNYAECDLSRLRPSQYWASVLSDLKID